MSSLASIALALTCLVLGGLASGCGGEGVAQGEPAATDLQLGIIVPGEFRQTSELAPALDLARLAVTWEQAQPNCQLIRRGRYRWAPLDRELEQLTGRGVPLIVTISRGPRCASEVRDGEALEPKRRYRDDFARFAAALVARYGPDSQRGGAGECCGIEQLEVWNEPNIQAGWTRPSARAYASLLKATAKRVRAKAGREVDIVSAGLAASQAERFARELVRTPRFAAGIDAFGLHTYAPSADAALRVVRQVRDVLRRGGAGRTPIAITEHGWSTCARPSPTLFRGKCTTREGQAALLGEYVEGLRERPELGARSFLWLTPQDVGEAENERLCPTSPKYFFGFFDRDGEPKPSWTRWLELTGAGADAPQSLAPVPEAERRDCGGR